MYKIIVSCFQADNEINSYKLNKGKKWKLYTELLHMVILLRKLTPYNIRKFANLIILRSWYSIKKVTEVCREISLKSKCMKQI